MKPPPFLYVAPTTLKETLELLAEYGSDAKLLAGGQSLIPLLNFRLIRPKVMIDLNRVRDLDYIRQQNGEVRIGAMTRQRAAEHSPTVAKDLSLMQEALRWVGHPQIRSRGTIGGSLAHADPAAELPAVVHALGGTLVIASKDGERVLRPEEFFVTYLTTALSPTEVLTEVRVPVLPPGTCAAFLEIGRRRGDFALVAVAAVLRLDEENRCRDVRIAFTGVGGTPVRVPEAESAADGRRPDEDDLGEVATLISDRLEPDSDIHASAAYRKRLAGVLAVRALKAAVRGAEAGTRNEYRGERS